VKGIVCTRAEGMKGLWGNWKKFNIVTAQIIAKVRRNKAVERGNSQILNTLIMFAKEIRIGSCGKYS
jgi:hypothetical protein